MFSEGMSCILMPDHVQVLMMRRKQESGEGDSEPQPMVEDFAQNRQDNGGAGEKQCLASANPPAAIAQRQAAVTATPTPAQIAASKEPAPGQPLSVDIPSKDSLPEHHIQVRNIFTVHQLCMHERSSRLCADMAQL